MTEALQRLHEAANASRAVENGLPGADERNLTQREHEEYVALRNAYATGSLIPAESISALVEAGRRISCEVGGPYEPHQQRHGLVCGPCREGTCSECMYADLKRLTVAALKEVSQASTIKPSPVSEAVEEAIAVIEHNASKLSENGGPRLDLIDEALATLRAHSTAQDAKIERLAAFVESEGKWARDDCREAESLRKQAERDAAVVEAAKVAVHRFRYSHVWLTEALTDLEAALSTREEATR